MPYEAFRHAILLYFRHRFTFWVLWRHENWLGRVKTSPFLAFLGSKTKPNFFEMTQNNLREVPEGSLPSLDQEFLPFQTKNIHFYCSKKANFASSVITVLGIWNLFWIQIARLSDPLRTGKFWNCLRLGNCFPYWKLLQICTGID